MKRADSTRLQKMKRLSTMAKEHTTQGDALLSQIGSGALEESSPSRDGVSSVERPASAIAEVSKGGQVSKLMRDDSIACRSEGSVYSDCGTDLVADFGGISQYETKPPEHGSKRAKSDGSLHPDFSAPIHKLLRLYIMLSPKNTHQLRMRHRHGVKLVDLSRNSHYHQITNRPHRSLQKQSHFEASQSYNAYNANLLLTPQIEDYYVTCDVAVWLCVCKGWGSIAVHKWWEGQRDAHGRLLAGKPNVWARKVVRHRILINTVVRVSESGFRGSDLALPKSEFPKDGGRLTFNVINAIIRSPPPTPLWRLDV